MVSLDLATGKADTVAILLNKTAILRSLNQVVAIYSTPRLVSAIEVAKYRLAAKYKVAKYRPCCIYVPLKILTGKGQSMTSERFSSDSVVKLIIVNAVLIIFCSQKLVWRSQHCNVALILPGI